MTGRSRAEARSAKAGNASMRPIRETLPLDEALALVLEAASPVTRTERVPLREATGRVIAAAAVATVDVPPFDRAAMDGYAVVAEDTFGAGRYDPKTLRCIEKVYTGDMPTRRVARGECTEIATGAPMPEGADAVVMVEESEKAGEDVRIFTPVYPRQHVGRRATGACRRGFSQREPRWRDRGDRRVRSERVRQANRRDPLDR
jgi:molybdopterin biosynthesis enzyme